MGAKALNFILFQVVWWGFLYSASIQLWWLCYGIWLGYMGLHFYFFSQDRVKELGMTFLFSGIGFSFDSLFHFSGGLFFTGGEVLVTILLFYMIFFTDKKELSTLQNVVNNSVFWSL